MRMTSSIIERRIWTMSTSMRAIRRLTGARLAVPQIRSDDLERPVAIRPDDHARAAPWLDQVPLDQPA